MVLTLVEALLSAEAEHPERTAYRYLHTGDADGAFDEVSYRQLADRSRAVAGWLQDQGLSGERAMLLYPPGVEFVAAYLGCLLAGVAAVPGVPPMGRSQNHRAFTRMKRLIADADARVVLGGSQVIAVLRANLDSLPELADIPCVAAEDIPADAASAYKQVDIDPGTVAFLQYTSGSTSAPRGVTVTHGNLIDNEIVISERMGHTAEALTEHHNELYVSWLPVYHDMGLIAPVLNTVYHGATSTLFSPLDFLHKPERWLTAISKFRPHTSGGPNFAFELCLRDATPELLERLDLSSWKMAFNGSEPVRAATMRRFAEVFAPTGFRSSALTPCYGLAEATLMVTGGSFDAERSILRRSETPLGATDSSIDTEVVSCGTPCVGMTVVIAEAETGVELGEDAIGEIWISSASVARGYWRNTMATRELFKAKLADGTGPFLRTGDLGFFRNGELFVTGRVKDLMVIDGRNHYPQDLELLVEAAHPALRPGCTAAFSVDETTGEQPVVVAEAAPEALPHLAEIAELVRSTVGEAHGLSLRDVVLVKPGTIPKTSSGKIQRRSTREKYLAGTLAVVDAG